jgi:hypothetical protein
MGAENNRFPHYLKRPVSMADFSASRLTHCNRGFGTPGSLILSQRASMGRSF